MKLKTTFELAEGRVLVFTSMLREVERAAQLLEEVGHFTFLHDSLWRLWNIKSGFQINLLSFLIYLLIHLEHLKVDLRVFRLFGHASENFVNLSLILLSLAAVK